MNGFKKYLKELPSRLVDPEENKKILSIGTYSILSLVATLMTILNVLTDKGLLTYATGLFAVLCIINLILSLTGRKGVRLASIFLSVEMIVMFSFFLISGNPDGFSAIWICLLPPIGMLFYGRKRGIIVCILMEIILICLLQLPLGQDLLMYDYNPTFRARFPILFAAATAVSILLEMIRQYTYVEMCKLRDDYKNLSRIDYLTKLSNRQGLFSQIDAKIKEGSYSKVMAVLFDIDYFKKVNDEFGHEGGDDVLRELAEIMKADLNGALSRWGGEEFLIVSFDGENTMESVEKFRKDIETHEFSSGNNKMKITISVGVSETSEKIKGDAFDRLIKKADFALYDAKNEGRNKVVHF